MSKENLVKLLETAATDEQLGQQLQSTSSYEDIKSLAREQGFDLGDLSEEEARRTIGVITGEITEELSDEELEMVAGAAELPLAFECQGAAGEGQRGIAGAERRQAFQTLHKIQG